MPHKSAAFYMAGMAAALLVSACVPPREAAFFINLREYSVYVKKGFEDPVHMVWRNTERNTIPAPGRPFADPEISRTEGWKKVSAAGPLKIKNMDFGFPRRVFLSPLAERDKRFTILLEFFADGQALEKIRSPRLAPGMFFSGIGDNWAVYLNGNEVREEMYLDGEGQIRSHRFRHDVFFPVDKDFFREGINTVEILIAGGPNSDAAGIYRRGPWYIAPYENIMQWHTDKLALALCGVCFFAGLYYFLIFMNRRSERYNLYFSLFSIVLGIYGITRTVSVYSLVPDSGILVRIEYAAIFSVLPLLAAFVEYLSIKRIRRAVKIYAVFCLACAAGCLFPSLSTVNDIHTLWEISAVGGCCYLFGYDVAYAFFLEVRRNWKKARGGISFVRYCGRELARNPLGNLFISMSLLFVTGLLDILNSLFIQYDIFLSRYGFFIFALGSAFILNGKFNVLYRKLNRLNAELETSNLHLEETVRRRTKELEKQTRAAEAASRAKSEFLAQISHEIRTPMNAILGMTELMFQKNIPQEVYENALYVRQAGKSLLSIINDILDFSKIESGRLELVPAEYALSSLLYDSITIIKMRFAAKPLLFLVYADGALPDKLTGDENRLRQIVLNLLTNAFKYTQKGSVSLSVRGERRGEREIVLSFEVKDTGIGIKQQDMKKLFDTFIRLDLKRNRNIEGTGLGLAIARNLCRLMDGDITVESRYGAGSTFTARVFQHIRSDGALAQVSAPEKKPVLAFENRAPLARSLRESLENLGVSAVFAESPEAFFAELEKGPGFCTAPGLTAGPDPPAGQYTFAFVPSCLAEESAAFIRERKLSVKTAALADGSFPPPDGIHLIQLPVYAVPLAHFLNGKTLSGRHPKEPSIFTFPGARVLVVDDIAVNIKVTEGFLSHCLIDVDSAGGGEDALRAVEKNGYDLILLDHMMPGMDGVETLMRIRDLEKILHRKTPVIALTANALSGMKKFFLERGFDDFLAKPVEVSKLDEILIKWIPAGKRKIGGRQMDTVEKNEMPQAFSIEGLDTAAGLASSGGSMEAYREILAAFLEDAEEKREELKGFSPDTEDLRPFTVAVHGIKGAAASIGAVSLSEKALALERAGKSAGRAEIEKNFADFYRDLEITAARVKAALG